MSFHRNPWVAAEERYLDGLSDEEKAIYKSASAENLLYGTSAAQIRHEKNSRSRAAAKKLRPLIAAVTQYGRALDVISNTAPLFFSPVWGGLRVLLHVAREFDKYYLKLIDMLERIGDIIPQFQSYERLFPKYEQLLYSISAVYLDIIVFCTDAKALFQKAKTKKKRFFIQLPGSGLRALKVIWKPFDEDFGDIIDKFRRHAEKVELEVQLANMAEQAVERKNQGNEREAQACERAIAGTERKRQLLLHKEQLCDKLLGRLSQCDQDYKHRIIKKVRVEGTGQWILSSPEFNEWLSEDESSCLWCYGIPGKTAGSGKSIVATVIVDTIRGEHLPGGSSLAWFYCDYSEPRTLEPSEIVGSLIKQLLPIPLLTIPLDLQLQLEKIYENGRVPDIDELFDMFSKVIGKLSNVFIIIDGLDECKEAERGLLFPWLKALSTSSETTVKLFVTSRDEVDIKTAIGDSHSIRITREKVSSDISVVVEDLVRKKLVGKRDWSQDPVLVQEIIDALIAGAQGMFLWVTLQLDDICEELSEDGVRDALKRLPEGLNGTFTRALQKIHMRGQTQVTAAQRVFMWLVSAKRILTLGELQEAVSIQPGDKSLTKGKLPDGQQLVRVCGSLIVYDPQENTIKLAHYTVHQFLLSAPSPLEISLGLPNFHSDLQHADIEAGRICMTYLCFSAFETQIAQRTLQHLSPQETVLLESQTTSWVPHMAGFNQSQATMWNLFRGKVLSPTGRTPDVDFNKYLYHVKKPAKDLMHEYNFLGYVIESWVKHAASFTQEDPEIWEQFHNVALERHLPFDFQPWSKNSANLPRIVAAFRWGLENTHEPLVRLAIDSNKYDQSLFNFSLGNSEHALCFASRMGHKKMVEIILPAFRRSFDMKNKTPIEIVVKSIISATSNGHPDIAITLLCSFQDLTSLHLDEVFDGHKELSNIIIEQFSFRYEDIVPGEFAMAARAARAAKVAWADARAARAAWDAARADARAARAAWDTAGAAWVAAEDTTGAAEDAWVAARAAWDATGAAWAAAEDVAGAAEDATGAAWAATEDAWAAARAAWAAEDAGAATGAARDARDAARAARATARAARDAARDATRDAARDAARDARDAARASRAAARAARDGARDATRDVARDAGAAAAAAEAAWAAAEAAWAKAAILTITNRDMPAKPSTA